MSSSLPVYMRLYGKGERTVVLLHGFLASSEYWRRVRPLLVADGWRVVVVDLLGFGRAPKPKDAAYSYDDHIVHIDKALDALECDSAQGRITLVGHSMGALLSLRYACLRPERIRSVVLLHPPLYRSTEQAVATLRATGRLYRFLLDSGFRRLGWSVIKILPIRRIIASHSRHARERSLRQVIESAQALDDLGRISTETILLVGNADRAVYKNNLADAILSRKVRLCVEDVGHHSAVTKPQLARRLINSLTR